MSAIVGAEDRGEPEEDSLFAAEQRKCVADDDGRPWWQRNFFLHQPVLFGTWDGVFTSVMVNIFGIIVFLRMGWIVGTAGIANAILLLIICTSLALITVLSAVGICERCQIQSGGVYFLIAHVLGGRIGGAIGLLYVFGQAVATGLVAVGFGESIAHFFGTDSHLVVKLVSVAVLCALTAINMAGVTWVIKLQLLLLCFLLLAVIDFFLGSLFTSDAANGIGAYSSTTFRLNTNASYNGADCSLIDRSLLRSSSGVEHNESFFTVFGVFFANFLGVLAGVNMSGDLKDPSKSIPLGELSAVGVSSALCFLFIVVLGSTVDRAHLICDSMIAEHVSLTHALFLAGLYVSSLSSILGSIYGVPRVMQSIAAEQLIPILEPLAYGHGPNKNPIRAAILMTTIAIIFSLIGDLNQLAILSTMPFLITYAAVNYSYVSLAMTYDLQTVNRTENGEIGSGALPPSYGSMGDIKSTAKSDLDRLFPGERGATTIDPSDDRESAAVSTGHRSTIIGQPISWYSTFSNRYVALIGAIVNVFILLLVNVWYALLHLIAVILLYIYIDRVCPSVFAGISEFSIPHMFQTAFGSVMTSTTTASARILGRDSDEIVVTPLHPGVDTFQTRLTDDNDDYSTRKQYHQTKTERIDDFD